MAESSATPDKTSPCPELGLLQRRVLGVLVEKAKTTPDVYPMSLNALVTGCNQKSNRDPVLEVAEEGAEETLLQLQKAGLVSRVMTTGRVERWRHHLYDVWKVNKVELAILAELLLRGPQTEGELRGRASRMEPIADLETLRQILPPMQDRGLIVWLGPPGKRGSLLTHGFHSSHELARLKAAPSEEHRDGDGTPADDVGADLTQVRTEIADLRRQVTQLHQHLADLTGQLQNLRQALGE